MLNRLEVVKWIYRRMKPEDLEPRLRVEQF